MTKSAKQDTQKATSEQAEPESAATETTDVVGTDPGAEAAEPATDESATAEPATADGAKPELDDVKRKFREALDRKKQFHSEGQGKGGHESGKVNGAHGPAASRRSFRRKSG
jgi:Family of unknown function (DUF5302)